MRYIILQLPNSNEAKFMDYEWVKSHGYLPIRSDYVLVYSSETYGEFNKSVLEHIFNRLNVERPFDYHAHSLSVSDVVGVEVGKKQWEYYYVDSIGFKRIWEEN